MVAGTIYILNILNFKTQIILLSQSGGGPGGPAVVPGGGGGAIPGRNPFLPGYGCKSGSLFYTNKCII